MDLRRILLLVAVFSHALACATAPTRAPTAAAQPCRPTFPYQQGWLGGDAAYSIPISASETVWLFGDSFVAEAPQADRRHAAFIHNSIGMSRCRADGTWTIDYAWARAADGTPQAFLQRPEADAWWWLFDGFTHDGRLYVGLLDIAKAPPHGPLALPFAFTGVQLARITNPRAVPEDWRVEVVALTSQPEAPRLLPASAMLVHDAYVYLYAFFDRGDGRYPRGLARLPLAALDGATLDVSGAVEYLARDGAWKAGLVPADARILMDDTATEMSVARHPDGRQWLALYNYPDVGKGFPDARPSDAVWVRTASQLEGPWSERRVIFRIPELSPEFAAGHDPNTGCYAAKEHPQFRAGDRITFTYVCNLFTGPGQEPLSILQRLRKDMHLYRPIAVAVDLPHESPGPP